MDQDPPVKLAFLGNTHAAKHLAQAAHDKGFQLVMPTDNPDLIFVSQDTPTDAEGIRDLDAIRAIVETAKSYGKPIILTSAVPSGFCRSLGIRDIIHQAELLRIRDAEYRAANPEMIIVGMATNEGPGPDSNYHEYLQAFKCPVLFMTWEDAEFAKMAINAHLIQQVEFANCMAGLAEKAGADWKKVANALRHDSRIGPHAYLEPGRWEASSHLMRDWVTLNEIEDCTTPKIDLGAVYNLRGARGTEHFSTSGAWAWERYFPISVRDSIWIGECRTCDTQAHGISCIETDITKPKEFQMKVHFYRKGSAPNFTPDQVAKESSPC